MFNYLIKIKMESIKALKAEMISGELFTSETLMPRSLVFVNRSETKVYNTIAKCRNTDALSIAKAITKIALAAMKEVSLGNKTEAAQNSHSRVNERLVRAALSCTSVYVTDKNGKIIKDSKVQVMAGGEAMPLRNAFKISATDDVYKLYVTSGLDWSEEVLVKAIHWKCRFMIEQMEFPNKIEKALKHAADSNEAEAKAKEEAEKAEKAA